MQVVKRDMTKWSLLFGFSICKYDEQCVLPATYAEHHCPIRIWIREGRKKNSWTSVYRYNRYRSRYSFTINSRKETIMSRLYQSWIVCVLRMVLEFRWDFLLRGALRLHISKKFQKLEQNLTKLEKNVSYSNGIVFRLTSSSYRLHARVFWICIFILFQLSLRVLTDITIYVVCARWMLDS